MSAVNKLIAFDCDGTLVDSQHMIVGTMHATFEAHKIAPVSDEQVRRIVGRSLVEAVADLVPEEADDLHVAMAETYKRLFQERHVSGKADLEPLYPGTVDVLRTLNDAGYVLGVATGKSLRGLKRVLASHDLEGMFVTLQTADHHPSKPHPSMVQTAILEAGSAPEATLVIGDTSFDIKMARAAGCGAVGVDWGYHATDELLAAGAHQVVTSYYDLPHLIEELIGQA